MDFLQMQKTISLVDIPNSAQLLTAISVLNDANIFRHI